MLTLTNPMTIITFIAIFTGMGVGNRYTGYTHAIVIIVGIFLGSLLWWLSLSILTSIVHRRINAGTINWINRASGIIIVLFGLLAIFTFRK